MGNFTALCAYSGYILRWSETHGSSPSQTLLGISWLYVTSHITSKREPRSSEFYWVKFWQWTCTALTDHKSSNYWNLNLTLYHVHFQGYILRWSETHCSSPRSQFPPDSSWFLRFIAPETNLALRTGWSRNFIIQSMQSIVTVLCDGVTGG